MKKIAKKRLAVSATTIRTLTSRDFASVNGGAQFPSNSDCPQLTCTCPPH